MLRMSTQFFIELVAHDIAATGDSRDVLASPAMLPVSDCSSITATGTFREPHSDEPFPKTF